MNTVEDLRPEDSVAPVSLAASVAADALSARLCALYRRDHAAALAGDATPPQTLQVVGHAIFA